jgi:hypothetical protein
MTRLLRAATLMPFTILAAFIEFAGTPAAAQGTVTGFCFGEACTGTETVAYLGDFCWTFSSNEGEGRLTLGVTHMGAKRFSMNGTIGTHDEEFTITGAATRRGTQWIMTLTATGGGVGFVIPTDPPQTVDVAGATLFYVVLDASSLNGQLLGADAVGFAQDPQGFSSGVSYAGAAELASIPCE